MSWMRHAQARSFSSGDKKNGAVVGGVKTGTSVPFDSPTVKEHELCVMTAEYRANRWWVVNGDLAKAHRYDVKWDKLYVWWKEGENAEIIEEHMSDISTGGDMFKRPFESKVEYDHHILDDYNEDDSN
jgi:hypothetical protein